MTDCSNFDKRCSCAHFVPFLSYYYCSNKKFSAVTVFMEKRILNLTHDLYAICCSKIWQTFLGVAKSIFLLQTLHYIQDFEFTHLSLLPNGKKDMAIDPLQICSTTTH